MDRIRRPFERVARIVCLLALLVLAPPAPGQDAERSLEQQVEAAILLNFARFATWPEDKFETPASAMELCIVGDAPFRDVVAHALTGKTVRDRPVHVTEPQDASALQRCNIAYFAATLEPARLGQLLKQAAGHGVFSVHEQAEARPDAVARFYLEERKVHFEINAAAAERERLQVSAKLLAVAQVVDR